MGKQPNAVVLFTVLDEIRVTGANFRVEGESESAKCDSSYE